MRFLGFWACVLGAFWLGFWCAVEWGKFIWLALGATLFLGLLLGFLAGCRYPRCDDDGWEAYAMELENEVDALKLTLDSKGRIQEMWRSGVENEIGHDLTQAKIQRDGIEKWFRIVSKNHICFKMSEWVEILEKRHERLLVRVAQITRADEDFQALEDWDLRLGSYENGK